MLGFIIILAPVTVVTVLGTLLAAAVAYRILWGPTLDLPNRKPRTGFSRVTGFVKDAALWGPRKLAQKVQAFTAEHVAALLRAAAGASLPVTATFNQWNEYMLRVGGTLEEMSEQTWRALWTLNNETLPRKINAALVPIRQRLTTVEAVASSAVQTLTAVSVAVANGLRELPWGVPGGLPQRVETFFVTYKRLWDKVWLELAPRVTELWTQIVPELRQRIEELERGAGGGIGQALQGLRNRVTALENQVGNIILPRLDNLEAAVEALSREVFGGIGTGLLALIARVVELERQVADVIAPTLDALRADLAQLRTELEQGIATGLEAFRERIEALELAVTQTLPQRIEALELAVETLVATALEGIEVGLIDLTGRIVSLETQIRDVILPGFDAILGRVGALEARIEDVILPRLTALENILAPAAFAALVLATMRTVAPNLFCRNVTTATTAVCADDEQFWTDLIGGVLIFAIALNPREVAAAGTALTGALGSVIAETVDH